MGILRIVAYDSHGLHGVIARISSVEVKKWEKKWGLPVSTRVPSDHSLALVNRRLQSDALPIELRPRCAS